MDTAEALAARLRGNPADHEAYRALKTLYWNQGDYGSLANLIVGWAGWIADDRIASEAYAEVADLLGGQLGDPAKAESYYMEALRRDPLNTAASDSLQSLWERHGEHAKLAEFLQQQVQLLARHGAPPQLVAVLRYRLGELWSKQFQRGAEALHHFRKAYELDPTLLRALYEARQLCLADGDLRAAAELFEREAAAEPSGERKISLFVELSTLCRDQLDDLDAAVSALERAHALAPADTQLAYELAALLLQRAERADERTARGDRNRAADLLLAIAQTLDPEQAVTYLESALAQAPHHEAALGELERLLEGGAGQLRLAPHWVAYLAAAGDSRGAHRRRLKLARAYAAQGQLEDAIYCLEPAAQAGFAGAGELIQELRAQRGRQPARPAAPPRREPPRTPAPLRDTVDLGDVQTSVGESEVIDSLREATAKTRAPESDAELEELESWDELEDDDEVEAPPESVAAPATAPPRAVPAAQVMPVAVDLTAIDEREPPMPAIAQPPGPAVALEPVYVPEPIAAFEPRHTAEPVVADPHADAQPFAPSARPHDELRDLRRSAAALAREQRQDEAASFYEEIVRREPLDREAFAFLDSYYRRKQRHSSRAELLESSGGNDAIPLRVRVTRLREAASTYEARLKDIPSAIRCFQLLAVLDTETDDAQRALRRLLERTERWDELVQLLELEIARAPLAEVKVPVLRRLAVMHRERRGDRAAAADALERMLVLKPDDRAVRDSLIDDLMALQRYEDAVPWLERKLDEAATRPQKLALLHQLALLYRDQVRDVDRAFAVYERMLQLSPGDPEILTRMADLDENAGNFKRMLFTLERQVAGASGSDAAEILARMAQIAEARLEDTEEASELLSRAVELAPERPEYLQALCALYEREQRYDDLVELLRERVLIERRPKAKVELYRRIALCLRDRVADAEGAYEAWKQLLAIGEDREALTALQQRALERDDPAALVDLLGRLAAIEPDAHEQRDLLFDRARLLSARLQRPADALADLLQILTRLDPEFDLAFAELVSASEAAAQYDGLARVLEQRLARAAGPEQQVEYARKLADIYELKSNDAERAVVALGRWASADPRDPEPHRRLCPLLTRARRYPELLRALDALTQLEPEPAPRHQAAIQAAELAHRRLNDADAAWLRLVPLVEQGVPDGIKAVVALAQAAKRLDALYDLLEQAGQIDRLLSLLRERVARDQDAEVRAALLRRTAQLLIEYSQDEDGAAEAYRKLLELEEDGDALRFMQSLAVRRDDPETLADALKRLAALEQNPQERRDLLFEHARLLRARLARPAEAVAVLQQIAAEHPDDGAVLQELLLAAEAAADHKTVASTLERLLARATTREGRVELAERLADVCERELRDAARAIAALQQWAAADPEAAQPHRRLRPLLQTAGRDRELLVTLDALAQTEGSAAARLEATLAAAALAHGQFGDAEGAWQRLLPLLSVAEPKVDQALLILALELKRLDELYALLEQAKRYNTLVDLLRQRVGTEQDPALRVALLRRMARTLQGPLEDERGAEQAWARLLQVQEDVEALQFMRGRASQRDDMEMLGDSLRRLAALEQDPTERRDLLYEHGHLLHARLRRPAEAIAVLRAVVEQLDPEFEPALDELVQACEAVRDDATLAWALTHVMHREADPDRRIDLARRLATLYEQGLRDPERALAMLRVWSEATPNDAEPHHRMVALLGSTDRHAELLAELDAVAHSEEDVERCAEALLRGAQLALERLADPDGAWTRLLPLANSGHLEAEALLSRIAFGSGKIDRLIALYESAERYDDLAAVLREQAEAAPEPATKVDLYRRCAQLLAGPLADEVAAAEAFREVLRLAEDAEALWFLRGQAVRLDDPEDHADILRRLAKLLAEPAQRRDLLFERALLLADRLERSEEAAAEMRAILTDLDPRFAPAMEELVALAEAREHHADLAFALEHQLAIAPSPHASAEIAARLAALYEDQLDDPARALTALRAWRQAAPRSPEPLRRLRPHLERQRLWPELREVLDGLSEREPKQEERTQAALAAASLSLSQLSDAEGAWQRLSPLMLARDPQAEAAARELCAKAGLQRPLANLYVLRAQSASPELAAVDWIDAASLYEDPLNEPAEALEASLRALALDLHSRTLLDRIDRLAIATAAWERLWRVYNRLIQAAGSAAEQIELLSRHAEILERHARDGAAALDRWLHACRLDPLRDELLERAERLAAAAGANAELLWIYERLYQNARNDEQRARQLLRAAKLADLGLKDREQAMRVLIRALSFTEELPSLGGEIEDMARELDRERPELGRDDARRALVQGHMELAQTAGESFGPLLVLRASQLLRDELRDDNASFDALKQGASMFPNDLDLYDALERSAIKIKRLDALDAHLARCEQRASELEVKRALLYRRGRLLAEHLKRAAKAAEVYRELIALDASDQGAFEALLRCLKQAGRYQDLLKVYAERIAGTDELHARLDLMRQMAQVWEIELKNRPGAIEVWHEVRTLAPDDEEAAAALSRLQG